MWQKAYKKYMESIKIFKSLIANSAAVAMYSLITLLIIPVVTRSLGTEAYGFVSLAGNFVSYATILTIALNSYSVRYISLYYHNADYDSAQKFYSTIVIANAVIGVFIILAGIMISASIDHLLVVYDTFLYEVRFLFLLTFIDFSLQTFENTFSVFAYIHDRVDLVGVSRTTAYIIEIVVFFILFKQRSPRIWYVSLAQMCYSVVMLAANLLIANRYAGKIQVVCKRFSFKAAYKLVINGLWNAANSLGNILNTGLDLYISNRMLSSLVVGELAIAKTMGAMIPVVYQLISQVFQPVWLKKYADGDRYNLVVDLKKAMKLSGFCVGTLFCVFVAVGDRFYELWLKGQSSHQIYLLTIFTLMGYLMEGVVGPLYYIYTLCVKNKVPCFVTIMGGVVNVISMSLLLRYTELGAYAVCGTTAVIMTFINVVTNPLYMTYCLKIKWNTFYPIIIKYLFFIGVMSLLLRKMSLLFNINTWMKLIFISLLQILLSFVIYLLIMRDNKNDV